MPSPSITSALSQAGKRLLNTLLESARDYAEETDRPEFTIIEHWTVSVIDSVDLKAIFDSAQDDYLSSDSGQGRTHARRLEMMTSLVDLGGDAVPLFTENLWRTYLFRLEDAPGLLWSQYPELQRTVSLRSDRELPGTWGDWVLPMQTFMGLVEARLIERAPAFEDLLQSQDVVELLSSLIPAQDVAPVETGSVFVPDEFDVTTPLWTYLTACVEQVGHIDPRGLPQVSRAFIPINDVYTPLRLLPISAFAQPVDYTRYQTATGKARYDDSLIQEPLGPADSDPRSGVTVLEALYRHPQLLIIGDIGSGKSTLMREVAHEYANALLDEHKDGIQIETRTDGSTRMKLARPLPIYVDLADFVDQRLQDEQLDKYMLRLAADMASDQAAITLLTRLISHGQVIFLLDGLDRVATDDQRRMLVQSVSQAAFRWRASGNRIVVTARLAGYTTSPLPPEFDCYVIRPLDRSQIAPFLLRWMLALTRLRRPLVRDDEALQHAQAETLSMVREITADSHLAKLATNPLILRLLLGVFRPGTVMVPQRVAVFQAVADALIRDWRLSQSATNQPVLLEQEATNLMAHLAYWLHSSRPGGTLSTGELRSILLNIWRQLNPSTEPEHAEELIDDFIKKLNGHSGVLIEVSPGRYGFVYTALQEYFAARYLISSYRHAPERIRNFLHDPRWDEVIRLAIGFTAMRSAEDATDLIESAILPNSSRTQQAGFEPSPFENLLRRDLFFVARLLGSGIESRPALVTHVVNTLVSLWLEGDRDSLGRFNLIFDAARRHLIALDSTQAGWRALQSMLEHFSDTDEHRRSFAVDGVTFWPSLIETPDHLSRPGSDNQPRSGEVYKRLVQAGKEEKPLVRRAAAYALSRVRSIGVEGYRQLLSLVNDTDEAVAQAARETLRRADTIPPEALLTVLDWLRGSSPASRRVGLRQLKQVGALPSSVIDDLIFLLSDADQEIRLAAMETLGSATVLPENALTTICRIAMDTGSSLRLAAVNALRRPEMLPPEVINYLIQWSYDPTDVHVRRAAIQALGECKNATPDILEALMERLEDPIDAVRSEVMEPLAAKGKENARTRHMLAHAVSDSVHRVRCAVASALRHYPRPDQELQFALRTLLNDSQVIVREAALDTVASLEDPGRDLIDYVVRLVNVQDFGIGARAVSTLASLRELPYTALLALVEALPIHWETEGRAIADCLKAHHPLGMEIIHRIMDLAVLRNVGRTSTSRVPVGLRALALEILGYALDEAPDIVGVLVNVARDSASAQVQMAALRGLGLSRAMRPEAKVVLIDLLHHGPPNVRCAAGIALASLIHNLPDPPLNASEIFEVAKTLASLLEEITPRASWEKESQLQNDLLQALHRVVARSRPAPPRLGAGLE